MKKEIKITLMLVGFLAVVGYYLASPYLAVASLRKAAKAGNAEAMRENVDFPSVRESLKDQLNDIASKKLLKKSNNPWEKLGMTFAAALIGPMVDAYVTPENLARAINGEKVELKPGKTSESSLVSEAPQPVTHMQYETKNRFVVDLTETEKNGSQKTTGFVFSREGFFGWKLSSLRLPQS